MRGEFKKFSTESGKSPKSSLELDNRLTQLGGSIYSLVGNFSAKIFGKTKKRGTEEIHLAKEGGVMYPSRGKDFRREDWFKKLTPEKKEETEFKIMKIIHKIGWKEIRSLENKFLNKLPDEVREYFEKNRKKEMNEVVWQPPKEIEKEVIRAIQEYTEYFGFPPGFPPSLGFNCVGFANFMGVLLEHYNFKSAPVEIPGHVVLLVDLRGNKRYVSDINFPEPLPFKKWIEEMEKQQKIKKKDIKVGYFGGYEGVVHRNLGIFYHALEKYDKAEEEYRKAIEMNPNDASARKMLEDLEEISKK